MVFSSLVFVFTFLPLTLTAYYLTPPGWRNGVLLAASLLFYSWGEPVYVVLLIGTILANYLGGLLLEKVKSRRKAALAVLVGIIAVDLGILGFFKYYGWLVDSLSAVLGTSLPTRELPLPLGISFYTFQCLSYIVDIYWGRVDVQRNVVAFSTYIAMFPQLVAGPIVKYAQIKDQLPKRKVDLATFGEGVEQFIAGLAKKVLLANNIGMLWDAVKHSPTAELSVLGAWLGILAFTFQIYFDFSGYSDMAMGLGKMFGFQLPRNFNYPYISRSVTEFWRRWHMTLGAWFREYVYIPLGGNRRGLKKQLRNLFIVWFLTGLWHGASWNFVVWGLYFGVLVAAEKLVVLKWLERMPKAVGHAYTMLAVIAGWVIFEFERMPQALEFLAVMTGLGGHALYDSTALYYLYTNALLLALLAVCATPMPRRALTALMGSKHGTRFRTGLRSLGAVGGYLALLVLCTAYMVMETYNPFLYFRF